MNIKPSNEVLALVVALLATTLGAGYHLYINAVDFPTDVVRTIPFLWLILSGSSLVLVMRMAKKSYIFFVIAALSIPSILLGVVFAVAAMFGD